MATVATRDSSDNKLFAACEDGDWDDAIALIGSDVGLFYQDAVDRTVLQTAIANQPPLEVIQMLLNRGADVNQLNIWRGNSLHVALASQAHLHVVQLLIIKGANVNHQDLEGETPLILAARNEDTSQEIFQQLLLSGADPNMTNNHGRSAMSIVASSKQPRDGALLHLIRYGGTIDEELIQSVPHHSTTRYLRQIQLLVAISAPHDIPRLRHNNCWVHLLPSDLRRHIRTTLFRKVTAGSFGFEMFVVQSL